MNIILIIAFVIGCIIFADVILFLLRFALGVAAIFFAFFVVMVVLVEIGHMLE